MAFSDITNAEREKKTDAPSRKKPFYPINNQLRGYLKHNGREVNLPVSYDDLARITYSVPLKDKDGKDTFWEKALYDMNQWEYLRDGLITIYAILKTEGDLTFSKHLDVARIDYCAFGNSNPFRIRIVNKYNDNYDHFYIKVADASRIYGLELEHILSPNRITYFTHYNTLVEEHIPGIPGDLFTQKFLNEPNTNKIRFAKEFVKFNERCFVRLLGDMRSYNFVVDITPDIEDFQYRLRAIDFDQQSYEGRKNLYLPQYFKENLILVNLTLQYLNKDSIEQYQSEERTMMAFRVADSRYRLMELFNTMCKDVISTPEKMEQLKHELASYFNNPKFLKCESMGDVVKLNLKQTLRKNLYLIQQAKRKKTN
ncbi:hypothetical protein [Segetibacter koreensis]|uniref:hypothetical protein n=1 Tax=Segetibacter koreensis TaxID=398037 RepID=UPI00037D7D15|nr:hypothetical protein [Segetibacter koreensis]